MLCDQRGEGERERGNFWTFSSSATTVLPYQKTRLSVSPLSVVPREVAVKDQKDGEREREEKSFPFFLIYIRNCSCVFQMRLLSKIKATFHFVRQVRMSKRGKTKKREKILALGVNRGRQAGGHSSRRKERCVLHCSLGSTSTVYSSCKLYPSCLASLTLYFAFT